MKKIRVLNQTRNNVLCEHCEVADNAWTRTRGLMGRATLEDEHGLYITQCPSIHMFWMKFALDVVFVTRENIVTDIVKDIGRGKVYVAKAQCGKPYAALELPVGTVDRNGTAIGDVLLNQEK